MKKALSAAAVLAAAALAALAAALDRLRPERRHRVEPPRGAADLGGSERRQHRPVRVPEPGPAEHGHDHRQLDPGRGSGRRPELVHVLAEREVQDQHRPDGRRPAGHRLRVPLQPHGRPSVPGQHRPELVDVAEQEALRPREDAAEQHRPALDPELPQPRRRSRSCGRTASRSSPASATTRSTATSGRSSTCSRSVRARATRRRQGLLRRLRRARDRAADPDRRAEREEHDHRRLGLDRAAERDRRRQAPARLDAGSRIGNPLVNEVVVPTATKDLWNSSRTEDDKQFAGPVVTPILAKLMNDLYKLNAPETNRDDLVAVFGTGVKGLNYTGPTRSRTCCG